MTSATSYWTTAGTGAATAHDWRLLMKKQKSDKQCESALTLVSESELAAVSGGMNGCPGDWVMFYWKDEIVGVCVPPLPDIPT
jgi:hypothetical protein